MKRTSLRVSSWCALACWLSAIGFGACGGPSERERPDAMKIPDAPVLVDGEPQINAKIWAHSGQKLYVIDGRTLATTLVGDFTGTGNSSITDIAVNREDRIVGITLTKLFDINPATAEATLISDLAVSARGFTSLSFVPTDLSSSTSPERLVAANSAGEVFEINPNTGVATMIGSYGTSGGDVIQSSGDIVAVEGFGIYATVNVGGEQTDPDYLASIDPVTWKATPLGTGTGYDAIFGLGFWGGKLYGFVDDGPESATGKLIQITQNTGAGSLVNQANIRWFGAGVATDASIIE